MDRELKTPATTEEVVMTEVLNQVQDVAVEKSQPTPSTQKPEIGHIVTWKSDKEPGRTAPGAKLSKESSRQLQEDLAEIRRAQRIGSATAHFTYFSLDKILSE
jgi:hypothetical protein